jgi:hypothetical protein
MSLSAKYQAFLARPTTDALTDDAALHYITTLTTLNSAAAIIKHFTVQEKLLKRKGDKVLGAIETHNALSIELETTLEFINGGGAYLPGLDDNFVADRTVSFPTVCIRFCNEPDMRQAHEASRIPPQFNCSTLFQLDIIFQRHANVYRTDPRGAVQRQPEDFPGAHVLGPGLPTEAD